MSGRNESHRIPQTQSGRTVRFALRGSVVGDGPDSLRWCFGLFLLVEKLGNFLREANLPGIKSELGECADDFAFANFESRSHSVKWVR
jgi:hypothetical protein